MVTIRLSRGGAKKRPYYHIVATDSRSRRDGRYIERLGFFNPVARSSAEPMRIDLERVDYWVSHGAQLSERVDKLVKSYRKYGTEEDPAAAKRDAKKAARKAKLKAAKAAPVEEAAAATEEVAAEAADKPAGGEEPAAAAPAEDAADSTEEKTEE